MNSYSNSHSMFRPKNFINFPSSLVKKVSCGLIIGATIYVIAPKLSALVFGSSEQRIGRYTTVGLINRGNDCFITSSLQSLAGIPRFVKYLKGIRSVLQELSSSELKYNLSRNAKEENTTFNEIENDGPYKNSSNLRMPLHENLTCLIIDLVSVRESKLTISPQIVVKTLESIFKSKMSSKQNDAHEFTLVLLQTLQEEHSRLVDCTKHIFDLDVPNFPFRGKISKFLFCVQCSRLSEPSYQETFIRELTVPQQPSEKLMDALVNDETEIIENYSCLICQIRAILNHEKYRKFKDCAPDELAMLNALENYVTKASINENLPSEVEQYIKNYSKDKICTSNLKGNVIKKDVAIQLPEILVIHLSRSTFNGMTYSRNPCNVKFEERLKLTEYTSVENRTIVEHRQIEYNLKSLVKHTGSHSQGHYVCYRRKGTILFDSVDESFIERGSINTNNEVKTKSHAYGRRRYKKVKSALQYPYWRISDATIKESTASTVLNEQKYIYMLYYERASK